MTKSKIKVLAFLAISSVFSLTACKSGSGYGCDYSAIEKPNEELILDKTNSSQYSVYSVTSKA